MKKIFGIGLLNALCPIVLIFKNIYLQTYQHENVRMDDEVCILALAFIAVVNSIVLIYGTKKDTYGKAIKKEILYLLTSLLAFIVLFVVLVIAQHQFIEYPDKNMGDPATDIHVIILSGSFTLASVIVVSLVNAFRELKKQNK